MSSFSSRGKNFLHNRRANSARASAILSKPVANAWLQLQKEIERQTVGVQINISTLLLEASIVLSIEASKSSDHLEGFHHAERRAEVDNELASFNFHRPLHQRCNGTFCSYSTILPLPSELLYEATTY